MTRYTILCAALLVTAPAAAQDQPEPAAEQSPQDSLAPLPDPADLERAKQKVVDCEGEKFVFSWGAGAKPTRVTMCSKKDATPEELVAMLEDAASKLENSTGMAEDRRDAIVLQIRTRIDEIKGESLASSAEAAPEPVELAETAPQPSPQVQVPRAAPVASVPSSVAPRSAITARPRLSIGCDTPGDSGGGAPCAILGRDTRLTVTAAAAVPSGLSLRFLRRGQNRADISLRQMSPGQSMRLSLPRELCAGVVRSQTTIQVVSSGQVVDSHGPYQLRC